MPKGSVYVVGTVGGPFKIGWSTNVKDRIASLQTASPHELRVLALVKTEDRNLEGDLQMLVQDYHLRGEWYAFEGLRTLVSHLLKNRHNDTWIWYNALTGEDLDEDAEMMGRDLCTHNQVSDCPTCRGCGRANGTKSCGVCWNAKWKGKPIRRPHHGCRPCPSCRLRRVTVVASNDELAA